MEIVKYKVGQKIQAYIDYANQLIEGTITEVAIYKGRLIYNLDNNRFVYSYQVLGAFS